MIWKESGRRNDDEYLKYCRNEYLQKGFFASLRVGEFYHGTGFDGDDRGSRAVEICK